MMLNQDIINKLDDLEQLASDLRGLLENATAQSEDADDLTTGARPFVGPTAESVRPSLGATKTQLRYVNQAATRNKPCTANLETHLVAATGAVFGAGCQVNIYSGGQDRKGQGTRRLGSVRHDDFGAGGRAADVHIFDADGHQITGLDLARLGQYWLAHRLGSVGHEMRGGGIHLDEWTTPPAGGGLFWTYDHSNTQPWGAEARRMLMLGHQGIAP